MLAVAHQVLRVFFRAKKRKQRHRIVPLSRCFLHRIADIPTPTPEEVADATAKQHSDRWTTEHTT
jgi:hypothetical protein